MIQPQELNDDNWACCPISCSGNITTIFEGFDEFNAKNVPTLLDQMLGLNDQISPLRNDIVLFSPISTGSPCSSPITNEMPNPNQEETKEDLITGYLSCNDGNGQQEVNMIPQTNIQSHINTQINSYSTSNCLTPKKTIFQQNAIQINESKPVLNWNPDNDIQQQPILSQEEKPQPQIEENIFDSIDIKETEQVFSYEDQYFIPEPFENLEFTPRIVASPIFNRNDISAASHMPLEFDNPNINEQPIKPNKGERNVLSKEARSTLKMWLLQNMQNPYPTPELKAEFAKEFNVTQKQISTFLINERRRYLQRGPRRCKIPLYYLLLRNNLLK